MSTSYWPETSEQAAEALGAMHEQVLEFIQSVDCSDTFKAANYVSEPDGSYRITRDGWFMLVMSVPTPNSMRLIADLLATYNTLERTAAMYQSLLADLIAPLQAEHARVTEVLRTGEALFAPDDDLSAKPTAKVIAMRGPK